MVTVTPTSATQSVEQGVCKGKMGSESIKGEKRGQCELFSWRKIEAGPQL